MRKLIYLIIFISIIFVVSAQSQSNYNIPLNEGWNLVYGFLYISQINTQDSAILSNNIKAIYLLIPQEQKYARIYPDPDEKDIALIQSVEDDDLAHTASWVYTDKSGQLSYNSLEEYPVVNGRNLFKGWNFLGVTPDMIESPANPELTLDDLKGNCNIEKAYVFLEGKWITLNPLPMEDNLLYGGIAVKVTSNCQLGTSDSIQPPTIP